MLPDYSCFDRAIGLDWYATDPNLRLLLDRLLPDAGDRAFAEEHVSRYGELCGGPLAPRAEVTDKHGPQLRRYDEWGREVDQIEHHPGWLASKEDLVRAGFTGLGYHVDRPVPAVVTAAMSYLVSQAETAIYCGLGMTSGAADICERYAPLDVRDELVGRLTSLDPSEAWEGGMFLTERQGGSDVGANTTRAVPDGAEWRLHGEKHFCSNVDAEVFIVLARPDGASDGARGLATFIVPRLLPDGSPNGFHIKRLKPKLGTVGVPTGEVELDGATAWLAGEHATATEVAADDEPPQRGINRMMEMVNGSRFGVALMGLGIHRRSFLEAAIYAAHREQWGQRIDHYPLVRETLVDLVVELEAGLALTFECAAATRTATDELEGRLLRRILVPLAKVRATREALNAASQHSRCSGGTATWRTGRWPASSATRNATRSGKAPRTSAASTSVARCAPRTHTLRFSRASSGPWIGLRRARPSHRRWTQSRPRWPTPRRPSPISSRPTTVCSSSKRAGSRTCWPTLPKARSCSTRQRSSSIATVTLARRSLPAGSQPSGSSPPGPRDPRRRQHRRRHVRGDRALRPGRARCCGRVSTLSPAAVWRITPELVAALDERLGPPIDGYVNGTQVWLTPEGPGDTMLEWRLHPVAEYRAPAGVASDELWDVVVGAIASGASPDALAIGRADVALLTTPLGRPDASVMPRVRAGCCPGKGIVRRLGDHPDRLGPSSTTNDRLIGSDPGGRSPLVAMLFAELETA